MVDVAQLVRAPGCGPGGRRFKSGLPPHFFARIPGKKTWSLKRLRFMARSAASCSVSCASYGEAVLHKPPFQMKQLHFIPLWSIVPFHSTIWSIRFAHIMRKWEFAPENAQNPHKILRYKRAIDLCQRKKITWSTLQCYVLLPPNGANRLSPSNRSIFGRLECYQGGR